LLHALVTDTGGRTAFLRPVRLRKTVANIAKLKYGQGTSPLSTKDSDGAADVDGAPLGPAQLSPDCRLEHAE
jgi:hypothetical protein